MVKFSIIVPVYNVENYLSKCVTSISTQSFQNYELLLINDGSTDMSGFICDEYALLNDNITVIHKKNEGLSAARNTGLEIARGEYIIFIDSDDYIEADSLEKFNKALEESNNPDLMITCLKKVYDDSKPNYMDINLPIDIIKKGNKMAVVNWMFNYSNSLWPSVRYVVRRSVIEDNFIRFPVGYLHEDLEWTAKIFLYANTFTGIKFYWYNHRMGRQGSITTHKNPKRTIDVINLVSKNVRDNKYNLIDSKSRHILFQRMLKSLFFSLNDYKYYNEASKRNIIETLNQNKDIFKYTSKLNHKIFIKFCNIFGFKAGLTIMSLVHRV